MQRLILLLAAFIYFSGCDGGAVGGRSCTTTDECPAGQTCHDGLCVTGEGQRPTDAGTSCAGGGVACAGACCGSGEICRFDACIRERACNSDDDCIDDTYCEGGVCIPWGLGPKGDHDEACTHLAPVGLFSPTRQCAWLGPPAGDGHPAHQNVLGTPVVVDFDFDGDPKAHHPSIAFVSYDGEDGGTAASRCDDGYFGVIRVIDGASCDQLFTIDLAHVRPSTPLAVGDLDLDGRPDIVAVRCGGGLVAFGYDAAAKAFKQLWVSTPADLGGEDGMWNGPSIYDLDDDGKPEILMGGTVWSNTGQLVDGSLGLLSYSSGYIPVAADLDGDGKVELVNGASVWTWQGSRWNLVHDTGLAAGQVAVADFGRYGADPSQDDRSTLDGVAEIAVVSSGQVRVQTMAGRVVFGPIAIPGGGTGGPPTIGDFDKDGRAEVAAAGSDSYSVFDPDCSGTPQQATCATLATTGVLWSKVSQDHSSNVTGSSVFDFEGDGAAEAVYADECFTRVYDGKSGEVLYSQWRSSCTWYENPIVADVDGDFNSELVVPSNTNCAIDVECLDNPNHDIHPVTGKVLDPLFKGLRCETSADCPGGGCDGGFCRCTSDAECGGGGFVCGPAVTGTTGTGDVCRAAFGGDVGGVFVYRDVLDRWVSSRMIWNQHAYAVTHINEDGTVPRTRDWQLNWRQSGLNNFRQNVQGGRDPTATPDLTARRTTSLPCDTDGNLTLAVRVCNRGAQPAPAGIAVTFYHGEPAQGDPICTATSQSQLDPGACEEVTCLWSGAPTGQPTDVYAVADDDGTATGSTTECQEANNTTVLEGVVCAVVQ